jgi:transposase
MRDFVVTVEDLAAKFGALLVHLDERQRRLVLAAEARMLGRGGGRAVAVAAGVREATVSKGVAELEAGEPPLGRVRRRGGGRKRLVEVDPELRSALLSLVEPDERGDPMSPLRWTTKSTRKLAAELASCGHPVSSDVVADLLHEEGFSLQANAKTLEGARHVDRDGQFRYVNERVKDHQRAGDPVVSVDTKKKEIVGRYGNGGREWRPKGSPELVNTHDFPDAELGKAIPYGIYDVSANSGWVNVGTDHDTAAFAVESLRRWWNGRGRADYPDSRRLLITADAGGSNSYRTRAWKSELAGFAAETGLQVTVCHFPPGTSKWNKVEHRLFSHITMNWRGRPLTSHEVIVNTIAATTTGTGLRVYAELDTGDYPTGVKVTDDEMSTVPITRHDWHGDWNYTIGPEPVAAVAADTTAPDRPDTTWLRAPTLTGLTGPQWDQLIQTLTVTRHAQREARLQQRRGSTRKAAPGTGRKAVLTLDDRLAITLLYQRYSTNQRALARLFAVNQQTIHNVIAQTRPLLTLAGHTTHPTGITLTDAISQYHSATTESD